MTFCRSSCFFALILAFALPACQTTTPERPPCLAAGSDHDTPCRPFRAGMVKLNPLLDEVKPLAAMDPSGWAISGQLLIGAVDDNWLAGMTMHTFDPRWFYPLSSPLSAPVSVLGDQVVVGMRDGQILSVHHQDGTLKWSQQLGRFLSRPVVLAGSIVIAVNVDQQLFALDVQTGNRVWVYDGGRPTNLVVQGGAAPVVSGQQVFFGTANGEIHSIDLATGRLLWRHVPRFSEHRFRDVIGQLAIYNQLLLVARYDGKVLALDVSDGNNRVAWENDFSSITSSAFRDGVFYVGLLNGEVMALDAVSGKQLWRSQTGETVFSLTTGEATLYAGGSQGRISALDNRDGLLLWHDDLQGALTHAPLLHDGLLYYATGLKVLYGYKIL